MTNRELLDAVRSWAAANYPGCPVEFITIHCRFLSTPIQLAMSPMLSGTVPNVEEGGERGPSGVDRCSKDILATLRAAGRPLTKTRLLEAMEARCHAGQAEEWSQRTVDRRLAELMADGTISNPEDARPRGYRLSDES